MMMIRVHLLVILLIGIAEKWLSFLKTMDAYLLWIERILR